jgi:hypothetical protein
MGQGSRLFVRFRFLVSYQIESSHCGVRSSSASAAAALARVDRDCMRESGEGGLRGRNVACDDGQRDGGGGTDGRGGASYVFPSI